ncbi:MAG: hypothetical protein Q9170_004047 [Blastenia crenularia]
MAGTLQGIKQIWQKSVAIAKTMAAKTKAYGKRGKENIAVQFDRLHLSSPNHYHALSDVADNQQQRTAEPKPKKKAKTNKRHRNSLVCTNNEIDCADVDKPTRNYLRPLTTSPQVSDSVLVFSDWARVWSSHCTFDKIAQGSYGAVFRIESKRYPGTFTIGKLIPLQARIGLGSRTKVFTSVQAAANEVTFLESLTEIPGFVDFRKAEVVQGRLPVALELISAEFDAAQEEGVIPSRWMTACSNASQLWLFMEMTDAGTDLETALATDAPNSLFKDPSGSKRPLSVVEIRDIFWQVASALALAEKRYQFEHRDLHLGNICLTAPENHSQNGGLALWTDKPSILVTIIDYTLSRAMLLDFNLVPAYYNDLSKDPVLFEGTGAKQYDVYRQMKAALKDKWMNYQPLTNVLWLSHLLVILMEMNSVESYPQEYMGLWNDLAGLKERLQAKKKRPFSSAQDVVRYCETGGTK